MHVSAAGKLAATTACHNADQNLPVTNDSTIPNEPKTKLSPALGVAPPPVPPPAPDPARVQDADGAEHVDDDVGGMIPGVPDGPRVTAAGNCDRRAGSVVDLNTTTFSFWPDPC